MRKLTLILMATLLMMAVTTFGQSLKKGNLVGVHTVKVDLKAGATIEQYKDLLRTKWMPAMNKNNADMKGYLLEGIRGEAENSIGFMFIYPSAEARNKYWNEDGTPTELQTAMGEKMQAVTDEGIKIGTWSSSYTDWLVQ